MIFEQFEHLSVDDAARLLKEFRTNEAVNAIRLLDDSGVDRPCFTVDSLSPVLNWVASKLTTNNLSSDENVPEWISETKDYRTGLFEFDPASRSMIVTAAFYLGQCFVQTFDGLEWGLGDPETALCNMPVVNGFAGAEELPPLLVLENVFRRKIASPQRKGDIERMIDRWVSQTT